MSLKYHEYTHADHHILNPFSAQKFALLGERAELRPGLELLDIACGKGEMLCQWSVAHGIRGTGVDISTVFLDAARARTAELACGGRLDFVQAEGGQYLRECQDSFDVVSCIGATWIGGGLTGTLELMQPRLRSDESLILVGEPFWLEPPPAEAWEPMGNRDSYVSLDETRQRIEAQGLEPIEMILSNRDDWDRYEAMQWKAASDWIRAHPEDDEVEPFRKWVEEARTHFLGHCRRYLGWGVFVLRPLRR